MSDDQALHPGHRSVRLKGYDYSNPGLYFVTVCAEGKKSIFGRIESEKFQPSRLGWIVHETWIAIPRHYATTKLHAFVVMPNHFHGILQITGPQFSKSARQSIDLTRPQVGAGSLSAIGRSFKSEVIRRARRELEWSGDLWQRSYFERVIRDGEELARATRYVAENAARWQWDKENPLPANPPQRAEIGRSVLRPYREMPPK